MLQYKVVGGNGMNVYTYKYFRLLRPTNAPFGIERISF